MLSVLLNKTLSTSISFLAFYPFQVCLLFLLKEGVKKFYRQIANWSLNQYFSNKKLIFSPRKTVFTSSSRLERGASSGIPRRYSHTRRKWLLPKVSALSSCSTRIVWISCYKWKLYDRDGSSIPGSIFFL